MKNVYKYTEDINPDCRVTMYYDTDGGFRVVKEEETRVGVHVHTITLNKSAMFDMALRLLNEAKAKK